MNKVYYNQADSRWANHPYNCNYPGYTDKSIKTSGCGVTCGAMIISSCREIITPDKMGDLSMANGYRLPGGTADAFFPFICEKWGLEIERIHSSYEAFNRCKNGWFVVMCAGPGLWTTGGHFILAVGTRGDEIQIFDPYLYANKFAMASRKGAGVKVEGTSCYVQIDKFKEYSNIQRLFAIKVSDEPLDEQIDATKGIVKYVKDKAGINIRNGRGENYNIIGVLDYGTQILEYDSLDNWSRIGSSMYIPSKALSDNDPKQVKTKLGKVISQTAVVYTKLEDLTNEDVITIYDEEDGWYRIGDNKWVLSENIKVIDDTIIHKLMRVKVNTYLNVRNGAGTQYNIIGRLDNGIEVFVYEEKGDWARIGTNEWVSKAYLVEVKENDIPNTVGQTRILAKVTNLYSNPDMTGTEYTYKANTEVTILQNVNKDVDKIYIPRTGRTAYCKITAYK